jgi:transposase-like protein
VLVLLLVLVLEKLDDQLARELGISDCSLGKWKKLYGEGGAGLEQQADKERIKAAVAQNPLNRSSTSTSPLTSEIGLRCNPLVLKTQPVEASGA